MTSQFSFRIGRGFRAARRINRWKEIEKIWQKQDGLCYLTKIKIYLGVDASLDHIMPSSKGGKTELDNLAFCHIFINQFKGNRTTEEFIEFCKRRDFQKWMKGLNAQTTK